MAKSSTATADPPILSDGLLRFGVRPAGGTDEQIIVHEIDVLLLKMTCEECEAAHHLEEKANPDGSRTIYASVAFLQDLAARLQGLGLTGCTATVAKELWQQASQVIDSLKKNTNETPNSPSGSTSNQAAKARTEKSRKRKK